MTYNFKVLLLSSACMACAVHASDNLPGEKLASLNNGGTSENSIQEMSLKIEVVQLQNYIEQATKIWSSSVIKTSLENFEKLFSTLPDSEKLKAFSMPIGKTSVMEKMAELASAKAFAGDTTVVNFICNCLRIPGIVTQQDEKGNTIFHHLCDKLWSRELGSKEHKLLVSLWDPLPDEQKIAVLFTVNNEKENILHRLAEIFQYNPYDLILHFTQLLSPEETEKVLLEQKSEFGRFSPLEMIVEGYEPTLDKSYKPEEIPLVRFFNDLQDKLSSNALPVYLLEPDTGGRTFWHMLWDGGLSLHSLEAYSQLIEKKLFEGNLFFRNLEKGAPIWDNVLSSEYSMYGRITVESPIKRLAYFYDKYLRDAPNQLNDEGLAALRKWLITPVVDQKTQEVLVKNIFHRLIIRMPEVDIEEREIFIELFYNLWFLLEPEQQEVVKATLVPSGEGDITLAAFFEKKLADTKIQNEALYDLLALLIPEDTSAAQTETE